MATISGLVTVREMLALLRRWQVRVVAGEAGLANPVSWASTMRARLPAFEGFQGGELALLSLAILRSLRGQVVALSLPEVIDQLVEIGASAIAVAGLSEDDATPEEALALADACAHAERHGVPLLALPADTHLAEIEREVITHVVARRDRPITASESVAAAHLRASLRAEALEALLSGTYAGEAQMRARAAQLGYDLTRPHVVLWIALAADGAVGLGRVGQRSAALAMRLAETLEVGLGAWTRIREGEVAVLLPATLDRSSGGEIVERVETLLARTLGEGGASGAGMASWSAGLGTPAVAPAQVRRSAAEAHAAARLGLVVLGPGHIARPADLGVYQLLLVLREEGALAPFVEQTLAPLLADTRAGDGLIETLDAFFACNGNLSEAARRLHLHRNSLLYRLHRARELLGHDLDDPELRLSLQLAIKGRRVLDL